MGWLLGVGVVLLAALLVWAKLKGTWPFSKITGTAASIISTASTAAAMTAAFSLMMQLRAILWLRGGQQAKDACAIIVADIWTWDDAAALAQAPVAPTVESLAAELAALRAASAVAAVTTANSTTVTGG